jgi:hypothetical protein
MPADRMNNFHDLLGSKQLVLSQKFLSHLRTNFTVITAFLDVLQGYIVKQSRSPDSIEVVITSVLCNIQSMMTHPINMFEIVSNLAALHVLTRKVFNVSNAI